MQVRKISLLLVLLVLSISFSASIDIQSFFSSQNTELEPIEGDSPPQDLNGDGLYGDIDGDGELTLDDQELLLENRDSEVVTNNVDKFDFNGDGEISIADVQVHGEYRKENSGNESSSSLEPVTGDNLPQDLDNDGLYEDVNGDGEANMDDVEAFSSNREKQVITENVEKFDFNQDGEITVVDITALNDIARGENSDENNEEDDSSNLQPVTGENPPRDLNDDGLYEDVNGNGEVDIVDVSAFSNNLEKQVITENVEKFDFNQDGSITVGDVTTLQNMVSEEERNNEEPDENEQEDETDSGREDPRGTTPTPENEEDVSDGIGNDGNSNPSSDPGSYEEDCCDWDNQGWVEEEIKKRGFDRENEDWERNKEDSEGGGGSGQRADDGEGFGGDNEPEASAGGDSSSEGGNADDGEGFGESGSDTGNSDDGTGNPPSWGENNVNDDTEGNSNYWGENVVEDDDSGIVVSLDPTMTSSALNRSPLSEERKKNLNGFIIEIEPRWAIINFRERVNASEFDECGENSRAYYTEEGRLQTKKLNSETLKPGEYFIYVEEECELNASGGIIETGNGEELEGFEFISIRKELHEEQFEDCGEDSIAYSAGDLGRLDSINPNEQSLDPGRYLIYAQNECTVTLN